MENNEILEINRKEKELNEKMEYIKGTIEQYKGQIQEYKNSHPEEFKDENTEITDIHAIGSIKALRIEIENRNKLQEEIDEITKIRENEKKQVKDQLTYVQGTIEQYKKQIQEYKDSHSKEFENEDTEITDIHAIGSIKALRIELEKEKTLQDKMKLLNLEEIDTLEVAQENEKEEDSKEENTENKQEEVKKPQLKTMSAVEIKKLMDEADKISENNNHIIETAAGSIEFTDDEMKSFIKKPENKQISNNKEKNDDDIEFININEENSKKSQFNDSVRILYYAKQDKYLVTNIGEKEEKIVKRKDIEKLDKKLLSEKLGRDVEDLQNIDMNILSLLLQYDEQYNTKKASEYYEKATTIGKSKQDRKNEMEEMQIDIEYNLKGLYSKDQFSEEERKEILSIANNAKRKGIAMVKKGAKVSLNELKDKIIETITKKAKLLTTKKSLNLPKSEYEEHKEEEYDKLTNSEYLKSIDKDFDKELKKEKFKKAIKFSPKINLGKVKGYDKEEELTSEKRLENMDELADENDIIKKSSVEIVEKPEETKVDKEER